MKIAFFKTGLRTACVVSSIFLIQISAHGEDRKVLSKQELESAAKGKRWEHTRALDSQKIVWDLKSEGTVYGNNRTHNRNDSGTWLIDDKGQLCVKWRGKSEDRCVTLAKEGDNWLMIDSADPQGTYARLTSPPN
jgi:hypothetical protein